MSVKGISITLFIFIGAIITTYLSIWLIMLDSTWHLGQRVLQAATVYSLAPTFLPPTVTFTQVVFVTVGSNFLEVQHAIYGLSPVTIISYFLGYFFLYMIIGGVMGLIIGKIDIDISKFVILSGFVLGAAVFTTYVAVYLITIDAQWQLNSRSLLGLIAYSINPQTLFDLIGIIAMADWSFFEHAQGQSASSYVVWFIVFIIVYNIVAAVLIWINRGRFLKK